MYLFKISTIVEKLNSTLQYIVRYSLSEDEPSPSRISLSSLEEQYISSLKPAFLFHKEASEVRAAQSIFKDPSCQLVLLPHGLCASMYQKHNKVLRYMALTENEKLQCSFLAAFYQKHIGEPSSSKVWKGLKRSTSNIWSSYFYVAQRNDHHSQCSLSQQLHGNHHGRMKICGFFYLWWYSCLYSSIGHEINWSHHLVNLAERRIFSMAHCIIF